MRKLLPLFFLVPSMLLAESYWQQDVHYIIDAKLDTRNHLITGREQLVYTNNSPDMLNVVYFRLYWNLFTKGSYGYELAQRRKQYNFDTTGGIVLTKFVLLENGTEQTLQYTIDNTIMEVKLPKPLQPGQSITFGFEFEEKIPEGGDRTGHKGRDYNIAQWYPQIAVYDKYGWHKEQYLGPAEFHNDFGTFDVKVTLPRTFSLCYSGVLLNPEEVYPDSVRKRLAESSGKEETVRIADYSQQEWKDDDTVMLMWKFHADNVRDFAWTANEHYIWDVSHWTPEPGASSIAIHALYFTDKASFWKDVDQFGRHAISFFSKHFGMYAYPSMFVVEGVVGGGMGYPGIVFLGHLGDKNNHFLYLVVAHEIGHSWYPMMISSNETEFAFMDEGFNTFITTLAIEDYYGRYSNKYEWTEWYQHLFSYPNDAEREANQREVLNLAKTGYEEPIATHSYMFAQDSLAGVSIYPKTAAIVFMLQYVLGDSVFEKFMKEYYNRWKFKHPYPEDFYALASEVSGQRDLRWFFDEWFSRTYTCDYGIFPLEYQTAERDGKPVYYTNIKIRRYGNAIMPLDVRVDMADGSDTTVWIPVDKWMNAEVENNIVVDLPSRPIRAEINPDSRILDINRLNNVTGFPKVKTRFDNTIINFAPIDAYLITWRPSAWYTDEGGWQLGYKIRGSYLDDLYAATLWQLYNFRDNTLNYDLTLSNNTYMISPLSNAAYRWFRIEGRKGVSISFQRSLRRHYSYPPYHTIEFSYSYLQADNPEYLLIPSTWQKGILHRILARYEYYNRGKFWNVNASAFVESSTSLFARSDFQYSKRTFEVKTNFDMPAGWTFSLRFIDGEGYGDLPNQTKYYFANASPIEQLDTPFFRSKGLLPSKARDHALYPGGGNMRGYFNSFRVGNKIEAFNAEARFSTLIPFLDIDVPVLNRILRIFRSSLFFDAGRIASPPQKLTDQRIETDFGFGFRLASLSTIFGSFSKSNILSSIGLQTLRVDFPLYVSKPESSENRLKFRWVVSLNELF